jgi:hypothetical protein
MATVSFKEAVPAQAEAEAPAQEVQIVPAGDNHPKQITTNTAAIPGGAKGMQGEFTARDIQLPRLSLVQKIGDLADSGLTPGSFVFNKEATLTDGKTPLAMTVLRLIKQYRQKLEYGDPSTPMVFETQQEVINNGGSLRYGEPNYFQEVAHLFVALAKPEGLSEQHASHFYREHAGQQYTLAVYTVGSTAFTAVGKKVITAGYNQLRDGLWLGKWALTSNLQKNTKGSWFVPDAKFDGMHDKEAAAFFEGLVSSSQ